MKKVLVNILGLSYSQSQSGSYVVVLSELKGKMRKLPIIINTVDAQSIALKLEGIKTPRPLTHDLFKNFVDAFNIDLSEVYVYTVMEGIFYSKLIFDNGIKTAEVECTIGDALSLATLFQTPIYIAESVMLTAGISIEDEANAESGIPEMEVNEVEQPKVMKKNPSVEELEIDLAKALSDEDYEVAAKLRDRINKLKESVKK